MLWTLHQSLRLFDKSKKVAAMLLLTLKLRRELELCKKRNISCRMEVILRFCCQLLFIWDNSWMKLCTHCIDWSRNI